MAVEGLESRQLLAVTVALNPVASPTAAPAGITDGPFGLLWFDEQTSFANGLSSGSIGAVNATTKAIVEFPILVAGSNPAGIVEGPDGDLWFADFGTNSIGQFDPTAHAVAEYPTPTPHSGPLGIAVADGLIWFTEAGSAKIGAINPTTKAIVEFPLANAMSNPSSLVLGADGNLWYTDPALNSIGEFNLTDHTSQESPVLGIVTSAIALGSDGKLWFGTATQAGSGTAFDPTLNELDTSTHTINPIPLDVFAAGGAIGGIASGPDGKIYVSSGIFVGVGTGAVNQAVTEIGQFDPATGAYSTSALFAGAGTLFPSMVAGPDGGLWFTTRGNIGEATPIPAGQSAVAGSVFAAGTIGFNGNGQPIPGETVFVDLNDNGVLDPGDPSAATGLDGSYTITGVPVGVHFVRVAGFPGDVAAPAQFPGDAGAPRLAVTTGGGVAAGLDFSVNRTSILLPITFGPMPFGSDAVNVTMAQVTGLYTILLGRDPDAPGLAGWVSLVQNGTPFSAVVSAFLHSTAYYDRVIASDYQALVGRAPSPSEQDAWVGLLQNGYTEEQVMALMLSSDGFSALHPDAGSFVQSLYNIVLGRQASASEITAWETYLFDGATRSNVVALFVFGAAAQQRAATGFLTTIWGTTATPAAVANVVAGLQRGTSLSDMAALFFGDRQYATFANRSVAVG